MPTEHGSRQAIQARPDHPNRVGSLSRGLPLNMQQVAPALFVLPVPNTLATAVDALSRPW